MLILLTIISSVLGLLPDFSIDVSLPVMSDKVANVFSWSVSLLPIDIICALASITAAFYAFRFSFNLIRFIITLFKR